MKYSREERLDIGRRIYEGEISRFKAAAEYGISEGTARNYMRMYRDSNGLPGKNAERKAVTERKAAGAICQTKPVVTEPGLEEYEAMTKEELVRELVRARIREARLKKGTR